jgi:hypothetical protein
MMGAPVRVAVAMMMVVVVVMLVTVVRLDRLSLGIAMHQRLDHLAQRILAERKVPREKTRQSRENQGLICEPLIPTLGFRRLGIARCALQGIGEQLVHVGMGSIIDPMGLCSALASEQGLGGQQEAPAELFAELDLLVQIAAHLRLLSRN